MTSEMKENILKYLTGNLPEQTPSTDLIYSIPEENVNNLEDELTNQLGTFTITGIVQGKDNDGNGVENSVIYGNYDSESKGFMVVIDEYGNVLQIITQFTSEANIGKIYTLNVDENGYFYMIEYGIESNRIRFVMLNNIVLTTSDEYQVNIRRAYAIPTTCIMYTATSISKINKSVGQAKYVIAGTGTTTESEITYTIPIATQLTVNVGEENEWIDYTGVVPSISGTKDSVSKDIDLYTTWSGDTLSLIILTYPATTPRNALKYTIIGNSLTYTAISIDTTGYVSEWGGNSIILNQTTAYFGISGRKALYSSYDPLLFKINLTNNTSSLLYQGNAGLYDISELNNSYIQLERIENDIFFLNKMYTYDHKYKYILGKIRQDSDYYINEVDTTEITTTGDTPTISILYINKQFNLYNIDTLINNKSYNIYQIYNANNYNGITIQGYKSLLPYTGTLCNNNLRPIYARNLYNKVVTNNTTVSTLEIPKDFVNNISIRNNNLISYNQNFLVTNYDTITTNQYETLLINYINTINMINKNDIENPIYNINGASELNNSMSNTLTYNNTKATRYRINYKDDTSETGTLNWNLISQIYALYKTTFNIKVTKEIRNIEIISQDGTITYVTINGNPFEIDKTYSISQEVYINERYEAQQLYYGNDEIYYDNENVMYDYR